MAIRVMGLLRSRAVGAAFAQVWQAVGSFALQIVAAWTLGAAGLGLISLSLGIIVLATALVSGMVGDSLVILDREDPKVRGALQGWAIILVAGTATLSGVAMASTLLTPVQALLFAAALAAFQLEELVRRIFMGLMRFWHLVVVDSVAVVTTLGSLGLALALGGRGIEAFFGGLLLGQCLGIVVGISMLPREERLWVRMRGSHFRKVGAFGSWRGAQVAAPQLMLTSSRILVTAFAGGAALGLVEGARILIAPILLTVQGIGSYLLSSYVRDKQLGVEALRRRAWRASTTMMVGALILGTGLVLLSGPLGHLISGPDFSIQRVTAVGWVLYVVASASFQPFASLAAVKGRQRRVFACRLVDTGFAIVGLTACLAAGLPATWTPFILAAGLALGGALVRAFVLAPLSRIPLAPRATELRIGHV